MMNRVEMNEEVMEQINGGRYVVKIPNPEEGGYMEFDTYHDAEGMLKAVRILNQHGIDAYVYPNFCPFDDKKYKGTYKSTGEFIPA